MSVFVLLTAGRSERFGVGSKQLASIGPDGETIVDRGVRLEGDDSFRLETRARFTKAAPRR